MKQYPALLAFLMHLILLTCARDPVPTAVAEAIASVRESYAPDQRVARFRVDPVAEASGVVLRGETNLPEAKEALLERLEERGVRVVDEIDLLPAASLQGNVFGIVNLSVCNIRSEPRHSAELSTQAMLGTPLRIHKEKDGWFLVQTPDDYFGWLDPGGFTAMRETAYRAWTQSEKGMFLPDFGFAYEAPSVRSRPVTDLLAGNLVRIVGWEEHWVRIGYPDGREGYVPAEEIMRYENWLASRTPEAGPILSTAEAFLGRPYLWGGTSGKGVDCSGFTKTVFYLNGVMLPRDASQQVHTGVLVETDTNWTNLQPGDLLFFGRKATDEQKERIVHVAIYKGEGRIIHSAGTVKEESLRRQDPEFNEYRFNTFVRARRVLSTLGENGVALLEDLPYYGELKD